MAAEDNGGEKPFTPHESNRVGVRIPPFWVEEPAVWFAQIEHSFLLSGIKDDDTKFYYVTSNLENRYAAEVKDIIVAPPAKGKYEKLKTELIKRVSSPREKQLQQLLIHEEIGDRRPSQFLRYLQHLAGASYPEEFLKATWISRLPVNLQTAIAMRPDASLETLANMADTVHELAPPAPHIASAEATSSNAKIVEELAKMSRQIEALSFKARRNSRRGYRNEQSDSRSQSNYRKFPICFYHFKFGEKATKCQKPCDYKPLNSRGSH